MLLVERSAYQTPFQHVRAWLTPYARSAPEGLGVRRSQCPARTRSPPVGSIGLASPTTFGLAKPITNAIGAWLRQTALRSNNSQGQGAVALCANTFGVAGASKQTKGSRAVVIPFALVWGGGVALPNRSCRVAHQPPSVWLHGVAKQPKRYSINLLCKFIKGVREVALCPFPTGKGIDSVLALPITEGCLFVLTPNPYGVRGYRESREWAQCYSINFPTSYPEGVRG